MTVLAAVVRLLAGTCFHGYIMTSVTGNSAVLDAQQWLCLKLLVSIPSSGACRFELFRDMEGDLLFDLEVAVWPPYASTVAQTLVKSCSGSVPDWTVPTVFLYVVHSWATAAQCVLLLLSFGFKLFGMLLPRA